MTPPESGSPPSISRRRVLRAVGAGVGVGGLASLVLPSATETPDFGTERTFETDRDVEETPEDETPYAVRQYRADGSDEFTPTAPINVVFPLEAADFTDLVSVFEAQGWVPFPAEYTRYAWDREQEEFVHSHWTGAETHYGKAGRAHVRCWELEGRGSVQAHIDTPAMPSHSIRSYREGRGAVESLFEAAGWQVVGYLDLKNERGDHDGRAAKIRLEGST